MSLSQGAQDALPPPVRHGARDVAEGRVRDDSAPGLKGVRIGIDSVALLLKEDVPLDVAHVVIRLGDDGPVAAIRDKVTDAVLIARHFGEGRSFEHQQGNFEDHPARMPRLKGRRAVQEPGLEGAFDKDLVGVLT